MADLAVSVYELCEADVPGASLHGRDPGMLTVPELKRWRLLVVVPLVVTEGRRTSF